MNWSFPSLFWGVLVRGVFAGGFARGAGAVQGKFWGHSLPPFWANVYKGFTNQKQKSESRKQKFKATELQAPEAGPLIFADGRSLRISVFQLFSFQRFA